MANLSRTISIRSPPTPISAACGLPTGCCRRTLHPEHAAAVGLAFSCALLWLVHPQHSQCVNYIIQWRESLASLFYLLALYGAIRGIDSRRRAWLARRSSLPPHLRSRYMTGYTAATLCRKSGASSLLLSRVWCPLVATGVFDLGDPHGDSVGFERVGVWQYALNQCVAITHYLRLMVWPHPLLLDYGPPKVLTRSTWPGKCYWWWRFCFVADGGWFAIWPFVFLCSWPPLRELYPLSRSGLLSAGFIWRRLVRRSWYCLRLIMAWSMYRVPVSG